MKVITLQGKSNTGKSKTLKKVVKLFKEKYGEPLLHSLKYTYSLTIDYFDDWVVYEVNGKFIVIITAGDRKEYIEDIYNGIHEKYEKKYKNKLNVDILLVASHNNYKMNEWLNAISDNNVEVFTKEKLDNLSQDKTFEENGKYLFDYIMKMI